MFITTEFRFHSRNEPFPYDMTDQGGGIGTSYSFNVWDHDDSKVKLKCVDEVQWRQLEAVERGTTLRVSFRTNGRGGKCVQDGIAIAQPAGKS
jgi:hypothetical protein